MVSLSTGGDESMKTFGGCRRNSNVKTSTSRTDARCPEKIGFLCTETHKVSRHIFCFKHFQQLHCIQRQNSTKVVFFILMLCLPPQRSEYRIFSTDSQYVQIKYPFLNLCIFATQVAYRVAQNLKTFNPYLANFHKNST